MTSRKDYRKKNTQGSKYLIIAGVAVIVLACALSRNIKEEYVEGRRQERT